LLKRQLHNDSKAEMESSKNANRTTPTLAVKKEKQPGRKPLILYPYERGFSINVTTIKFKPLRNLRQLTQPNKLPS